MIHGKAIWKPGIAEMAKEGITAPPWKGKFAAARWVMA